MNLTFEEALEALQPLRGQYVEATIWGPEKSGHSIASLVGTMQQIEGPHDLPPEMQSAIVNTATVFQFGAVPVNALNLWPDRFIRATRLLTGKGIEVETLDSVVRISLRRPWVD
jgi:hypothetical protein